MTWSAAGGPARCHPGPVRRPLRGQRGGPLGRGRRRRGAAQRRHHLRDPVEDRVTFVRPPTGCRCPSGRSGPWSRRSGRTASTASTAAGGRRCCAATPRPWSSARPPLCPVAPRRGARGPMTRRAQGCSAPLASCGVPYFFIKVAVDDGRPARFVAWSRVALGATILLPPAWRRGVWRAAAGRRSAPTPPGGRGAVPAHRRGRAAHLLVAGRDPDRLHAADGGAAVGPLSAGRPADRAAAGRADRVRRGRAARGRPGRRESSSAPPWSWSPPSYAAATIIVNRRLADLDLLGPIAASLGWLSCGAAAGGGHAARGDAARRRARPLVVLGSSAPRSGWCCSSGWSSRRAEPGRRHHLRQSAGGGPAGRALVLDERLGVSAVAGLLAILGGSWLATGSASARGCAPT